ncbi:MAG: glycosyltransferase family 4 protein [Patescibacteria group bacterium]|nr:glycosyltransferase family 4 protein [Patescibacteria group bacterium]
MIKKIILIIRDILKNIFGKEDLIYIVECLDWSIKWDGLQITSSLNNLNLIKADVRVTTIGLKNKIIHFGSVNTYINIKKGIKKIHSSNKIILTWFHIEKNDPKIKYVSKLNKVVDIIHTSCEETAKILLNNGLDANKILVIPLGVDVNIFKIFSDRKRLELKNKLKIPQDKIIIGSFQKDGVGWGEGLVPKLIKGPDIFCDAILEISKKHSLHVLLTGPSRGYVKKRLREMNITYTHVYLKNYLEIVNYYNMLDLYIISSRVEGGPKALLECWATGVPVVSTRVGMVPDISSDRENVFMVEIDDIKGIIKSVDFIINDRDKTLKIVDNAKECIKKFSWEEIAKKYYNNIYSKII